ncbi:hypothetical protein [Methanoplanus limicola]|uniref:Uncharacterized protein n=1 Tax=Methanoplanus limicola DSM 2279 TaxID=937775 RepID=H1Z3F7_9EURY|nr:hypothetical protein [Methanoplanus limicola]EHQ34752.1 hypothetical protein Metlim_0622 [Methanoplanus limicola DSM 2279]
MKKIISIVTLLACIFILSYGFLQYTHFFYPESKKTDNLSEYNPLIIYENYSFSSDDKKTLFIAPDGWGPILVFDSDTSYKQINSIMKKYFNNSNISWRIMYDEIYMNYILHSNDKKINNDIIFFENQSCYNYNPDFISGINVLENPKVTSNGTIAYAFSLICPTDELNDITHNDKFKELEISETTLVYLFPEDGKTINNSNVILNINNLNNNEDSIFALKSNIGIYYPQIFKEKNIELNNSDRLWEPSVYFKYTIPDEEIENILINNIPNGVSLEVQNDNFIYANYYFDYSTGNLTDKLKMLNHFNDIIIYENHYYEELQFKGDNTGKCYYPVTILANEESILKEMDEMGLYLKKTKCADLKCQPSPNENRTNHLNYMNKTYANGNVLFIIKKFCKYCT